MWPKGSFLSFKSVSVPRKENSKAAVVIPHSPYQEKKPSSDAEKLNEKQKETDAQSQMENENENEKNPHWPHELAYHYDDDDGGDGDDDDDVADDVVQYESDLIEDDPLSKEDEMVSG